MELFYKSREFAGVLIGVFTLLIFLSPKVIFFAFLLLLSLLMAYELSKALRWEGLFYLSPLVLALTVYDKALGVLSLFLLSFFSGWKSWSLEDLSRALLTFSYTGLLPSFMWDLRLEGDYELVKLLFFVWVVDVSAYYVGKSFGKNRIAPRLSPNKTWEGFLGSLLFGTVYSVLVFKSFVLAILLVLSAFFGDLFKSFIKRQVGIKDFSNILGSHGGVIDRFDSLLFCAPVYLYMMG